MKVILFGATGMVGQGVLRECLLDSQVEAVLAVGRGGVKQQHAKLSVLVQDDLFDYSGSEAKLKGYDACCFCLGVSSAGMSEADYRRITFDLTLAAAETLARLNPGMTFMYVSGAGTDSSEKGRSMWARVKGMTENALLKLPFKAAYMFRPGIIHPLHGIKSKTPLYNGFYMALGPLLWLLGVLAPNSMTTTEQLGRAMLHAARDGAPKPLLETADINRL
ncbi:MAG: epimerase [Gammaproteobacteria bacterium]